MQQKALQSDQLMLTFCMDWLNGEHVPEVSGERVLLFTYGNVGYPGIFEAPNRNFVNRYHVVDSRRVELSSLSGRPNVTERAWSERCGAAIQSLLTTGRLKQVPTPREYDGAAILYGLA